MTQTGPTKTASMERITIGPKLTDRAAREGVPRISMWLWRDDLALLRALYRRTPGGYTIHIRAAVHEMCRVLREQLRASESGRELLRKLHQENL